MAEIKPAIDHYYMSTDGNIPYDGETEEYLGSFIDPYDFVYSVLADEMQVEDPGAESVRCAELEVPQYIQPEPGRYRKTGKLFIPAAVY